MRAQTASLQGVKQVVQSGHPLWTRQQTEKTTNVLAFRLCGRLGPGQERAAEAQAEVKECDVRRDRCHGSLRGRGSEKV